MSSQPASPTELVARSRNDIIPLHQTWESDNGEPSYERSCLWCGLKQAFWRLNERCHGHVPGDPLPAVASGCADRVDDGIASRLRAGESTVSVMGDYGVTYSGLLNAVIRSSKADRAAIERLAKENERLRAIEQRAKTVSGSIAKQLLLPTGKGVPTVADACRYILGEGEEQRG
jgi:hypothetical protein